jgi:hypothetical protein
MNDRNVAGQRLLREMATGQIDAPKRRNRENNNRQSHHFLILLYELFRLPGKHVTAICTIGGIATNVNILLDL